MSLHFCIRETPIKETVLNRKLKYFFDALTQSQGELVKEYHSAPKQFSRAAQDRLNLFDDISLAFRSNREGPMEGLVKMHSYCAEKLAPYPYYFRQLDGNEDAEFIDILERKYVAGKASSIEENKALHTGAEDAMDSFVHMMVLFSKAMNMSKDVKAALLQCQERARELEAADRTEAEIVHLVTKSRPRLVRD